MKEINAKALDNLAEALRENKRILKEILAQFEKPADPKEERDSHPGVSSDRLG